MTLGTSTQRLSQPVSQTKSVVQLGTVHGSSTGFCFLIIYFIPNLKTWNLYHSLFDFQHQSQPVITSTKAHKWESILHTATLQWQQDCGSPGIKCLMAVSIKWWCYSSVLIHSNNRGHRGISQEHFRPSLLHYPLTHIYKLYKHNFFLTFFFSYRLIISRFDIDVLSL